MTEECITFKSNDGESFVVKSEFKNLAVVVKHALEAEGNILKFPLINAATFKLVIEWTELYSYNPPPVVEEDDKPIYPKNYAMKSKIIISDQDKEFFDRIGLKAVLDLVQAANTLEYMTLYKNCIKYLALQIKGKNGAEVGQLFKTAMQEYGYFRKDAEETSEETSPKKMKTKDGARRAIQF